MKPLSYGSMAVVVAILIGLPLAIAQAPAPEPAPAPAPAPAPPPAPESPSQPMKQQGMQGTGTESATLKDIELTFGFVPQWMRAVPAQLLPSFWQTLKTFQLSDETQLDRKTKELIGLAVAAQIPCEYCIMFHTEAARMLGASNEEIREAVGMAAVTREASTMLNGAMIDKAQFRKELDRIMRHSKQQARK